MASAHCCWQTGMEPQLKSLPLWHGRPCKGIVHHAQRLPQWRNGRRQLAWRAASAADRPSGLPKLPPIRRIRLPAPASDTHADEPPVDVDGELWEVLGLCSIEELEELHGILFGETALALQSAALRSQFQTVRCVTATNTVAQCVGRLLTASYNDV